MPARRHLRFALKQVTFAGVSMPGATLDCWDDDQGRFNGPRASSPARNPPEDEGEFVGVLADGRTVTGYVTVGGRRIEPAADPETLVEFHGSGDLHGLEDPPA